MLDISWNESIPQCDLTCHTIHAKLKVCYTGSHLYKGLDVGDYAETCCMAQQITETFGPLDILINNAGGRVWLSCG
jgi:NAD(P)-dependent dehydrogenase (short-subunit alcohol dehydrogenase family)